MSAKIIIGADLVPTQSNYQYFKDCDIENLIGTELREKLNSADFTIFNLEVPLTDLEDPIDKCGPNLIAPTYTIDGLKAINPHFFTLANNHILDQGNQGLESTIELLDKAGISHAGAGKNLEDAKMPYITEIEGIKVGIYCCAEHEFSISTGTSEGANPFDPLDSLDDVSKLKTQCDYLIVLYHGGKEHYRYPSPYLQRVCRKLVDKGADLVVCQHSHCIGAEESWNFGRIVYGQGNFLFDYSTVECWKTGLLIEVDLHKGISYLPIIKENECVRLAPSDLSQKIMQEFNKRSEEIRNEGFVMDQYQQFAKEMKESLFSDFTGRDSVLFRLINKLLGNRLRRYRLSRRYPENERMKILNRINCEAWRELLITALECGNGNDNK